MSPENAAIEGHPASWSHSCQEANGENINALMLSEKVQSILYVCVVGI